MLTDSTKRVFPPFPLIFFFCFALPPYPCPPPPRLFVLFLTLPPPPPISIIIHATTYVLTFGPQPTQRITPFRIEPHMYYYPLTQPNVDLHTALHNNIPGCQAPVTGLRWWQEGSLFCMHDKHGSSPIVRPQRAHLILDERSRGPIGVSSLPPQASLALQILAFSLNKYGRCRLSVVIEACQPRLVPLHPIPFRRR